MQVQGSKGLDPAFAATITKHSSEVPRTSFEICTYTVILADTILIRMLYLNGVWSVIPPQLP